VNIFIRQAAGNFVPVSELLSNGTAFTRFDANTVNDRFAASRR